MHRTAQTQHGQRRGAPVQDLLQKRLNKYGNKNEELVTKIGQYV